MKKLAELKTARFVISAIGIVLGLAAAMLIFGIYEGGRSVLKENFWRDGIRVYEITAGNESSGTGGYLERADGRLLEEKMPEVKGSIPVLELDAQLKSYKASAGMQTLAVNEKYMGYSNLKILKGSFIKEQDVKYSNKAAVIDDISAIELFGTTEIIGQKVDIKVDGKSVEFVVTGVFKNFNKNIETVFDDEYPGLCFIPESVPEDVSFNYNVQKLIAMVDKHLHRETAEARLSYMLEKEHDAQDVYKIEEYDQLTEVLKFTDKYRVFAFMLSIVGLITGAIGVMNAMLLSIEERKREIGLYKFYGAGIKELQYDIVFRILALCISFSILGMLLGIIAGSFIGNFLNIEARVTMLSVVITVATATISGILCSIYPALRIKAVDPGEAIWGE